MMSMSSYNMLYDTISASISRDASLLLPFKHKKCLVFARKTRQRHPQCQLKCLEILLYPLIHNHILKPSKSIPILRSRNYYPVTLESFE